MNTSHTDNRHEECIINVDHYFIDRMLYLSNQNKFKDADSIYEEFIIDGHETEQWLFIEDLTDYV